MSGLPGCGATGPNGKTCDLWRGHDGRHSRTTIESWEQGRRKQAPLVTGSSPRAEGAP